MLSPQALRRLRPSATTLAFKAASVPFRTLDDVRAGTGLTHDIDGARSRSRGFEVPDRSAREAARVLLDLTAEVDFTLFEHFLADEAGHAQDGEAAAEALDQFDLLLRAVVEERPEDLAVLVVSDHGNVEDLSTRCHTLHAVPFLAFGVPEAQLAPLRTVADVGALMLRLLGVEG